LRYRAVVLHQQRQETAVKIRERLHPREATRPRRDAEHW
jgi:hypothetical protein